MEIGISLSLTAHKQGGGGPIVPPLDWRLQVLDVSDSAGDATFRTAMMGAHATKARPSIVADASATRTLRFKVPANDLGALLSYYASHTNYTVAAAESYDSTNGTDGTWSVIPSTQVTTGDAIQSTRQLVAISAGAARWVRIAFAVATPALTIRPLLHKIVPGLLDSYLACGASLEQAGMDSLAIEMKILAAYPTRDPLVFNSGKSGYTSSQLIAVITTAMNVWGFAIGTVLLGNLFGNDISNAQPISDDTPQSLSDMRAREDQIFGLVSAKKVIAARGTYRAYNNVYPDYQAPGSLPYYTQILDPGVLANAPLSYDAGLGIPRIDLYTAQLKNRAEMVDTTHLTPTGYSQMGDEWVRTALAYVYTGAWPKSFTETLVEAFEAGRQQTRRAEANAALLSLASSTSKAALVARVAAVNMIVDTKVVRLRFGTFTPKSGWNTFTGSVLPKSLNNADGELTGYVHQLLGATALGNSTGGQGAAGGLWFDDEVLATNILKTDLTPMVHEITGLVPGRNYRIRAIGSRSGTGTRNVDFTIGGVTQTLNVMNNVSSFAEWASVAPDANGKITLTIAFGAGNTSGIYLNAIEIQVL